jgi:hypothetical protein
MLAHVACVGEKLKVTSELKQEYQEYFTKATDSYIQTEIKFLELKHGL